MLKNPEEGISYSLMTSICFPLLFKELNCKKEKKKIRKNLSSLFNDNLGSDNESNMFFLIM